MRARLLGVVTMLVLLLAGLAAPAMATEARREPPPLEELGTGSEISQRWFPEGAEEQPFTEALVFPLAVLGVGASLVVLVLYLRWQPRFAQERKEKRRR